MNEYLVVITRCNVLLDSVHSQYNCDPIVDWAGQYQSTKGVYVCTCRAVVRGIHASNVSYPRADPQHAHSHVSVQCTTYLMKRTRYVGVQVRCPKQNSCSGDLGLS
jgi:hypothetical protein